MSYEILENSPLVMLMASALRHVAVTYALLADFIGCDGEIYRLEIVQRRKDHCSLHTVLIMLNFQIGL